MSMSSVSYTEREKVNFGEPVYGALSGYVISTSVSRYVPGLDRHMHVAAVHVEIVLPLGLGTGQVWVKASNVYRAA